MRLKRTSQHRCACLVALIAALALGACTDVSSSPNTGGSGGSDGTGGAAGGGGAGATGGGGGSGGSANTPPEATIIVPDVDSGTSNPDYTYDGFDMDLQLWYLDLAVEGSGEDAEDGTLSGDALIWKTNRTDIQAEELGTGETPTIRLYSDDCFGVEHEIWLQVTDSDEETTSSEPRTLFIWTLC